MTKLKPCPFCGGKARLLNDFDHGVFFLVVECVKCHASTSKVYLSDFSLAKDVTIYLWSRRADDE